MNASLSVDDRRVLLRSTEAKSDAADGMDQRIVLTAVDFSANAADINIDDVGRRIEMQIPHMLQKHGARDHLTGVSRQIRQEAKLSRQQFDFSTATTRHSSEQIDLQIADTQHRFLDDGGAATGEGIDARQHFAERKRLDQIVVAARTQTAHAIVDFTQRAQDQRRGEVPLLPQTAYDLDPVDARQHAVYRHDDVVGGQSTAQAVFAVCREVDLITARPQAIDQLFGGFGVVLDHKDVTRVASHRLLSPGLRAKSL